MSLLLEDIEDLIEESQIYEKTLTLDPSGGVESVRKQLAELLNNSSVADTPDKISDFARKMDSTLSNTPLWKKTSDAFGSFMRGERYGDADIKSSGGMKSGEFSAFKPGALDGVKSSNMQTPIPGNNPIETVAPQDYEIQRTLIETIKDTLKNLKTATEGNFNSVVDKFFNVFKGVPGIDSVKQFSETNPQVFAALVVTIPLVLVGGGAFVGYRKIKGMNSPQQAKSAMDKAQQRVASAKSPKEKAKAEKDLALYTAKYLTLSKKK